MTATMTQAEFSRLHKCSRTTVTKWKNKGLLVLDEAGRVLVDESNSSLASNGFGVTRVSPEVTEPAETVTSQLPEDSSREMTNEELAALAVYAEGNAPHDFVEARRIKENYLALLRQLEYETKAGRLVDAESSRALFAKRWSDERKALEDWPSRVAPQLAAKFSVDPVALRVALEDAVNAHLTARVERPLDGEALH